MIHSLLCKFPRWLGGDHRWRRLTKKEHAIYSLYGDSKLKRICQRCKAERVVKARKKTIKEET